MVTRLVIQRQSMVSTRQTRAPWPRVAINLVDSVNTTHVIEANGRPTGETAHASPSPSSDCTGSLRERLSRSSPSKEIVTCTVDGGPRVGGRAHEGQSSLWSVINKYQ